MYVHSLCGTGPSSTDLQTQAPQSSRAAEVPLLVPDDAHMDTWLRRTIAAVPLEVGYHVSRPHISAPDVEAAAKTLLFLIEWVFAHKVHRDRHAGQAAFNEGLKALGPGITCALTSHDNLLRNARSLGIRA